LRGEANARLWQFAEDILPHIGSGKLNQALMDLGSLICTAKSPKCAECPVVAYCESAKRGWQTKIPTPQTKEQKECCTEVALLVQKKGKTLLVRSPEGQRWAGLWDFPRTESASDSVLQKRLAELTGRKLIPGKMICSLKHSVTKYRITLYFREGTDAGRAEMKPLCETRWATSAELQELPLNSTARKLAQSIACVLAEPQS
jgi:A/G-specific adenine glycosylase